jgi:hypothetical protein
MTYLTDPAVIMQLESSLSRGEQLSWQGFARRPLGAAGACYAARANARLRREGGPSMTIETLTSAGVAPVVIDFPPVTALRTAILAIT